MKLITLNIWGGKVFDLLMDFIENDSKDTDIFCFQEMLFGSIEGFTDITKARINIFSEIKKLLPDFTSYIYYAPENALHFQSELLPKGTRAGQAIFIRKPINVIDDGGFRGYNKDLPSGSTFGGKISGSCQWVAVQDKQGQEITILNLHGIWQHNSDKVDTPERLIQSRIIKDFLNSRKGKKILCGDHNLRPDGESIKILEKDMVNLIKKNNITSTRSSYYPKPGKFADYIIISPDIRVNQFEVLRDEVSDHLALKLNFD